MPIKTALLGIVPPVVIALVVLLAAWRPWSRRVVPLLWGAAGSALALALAYAITETLVVQSWPGFPPSEKHRWLPYAGLAAAIGAAVWPRSIGMRWRWHDLIAVGSFALISWRLLVSSSWVSLYIPFVAKVVSIPGAVVAALWIIISWSIAAMMRRDAAHLGKCGVRVPLTWLVASVGAAVVYVQSYNALLAQLSGAMAAVMFVFVLVGAWRRNLELVVGLAPVFAVLYVGLMLACSDATPLSAILVLLAGTAPAFAGTPMAAKLPPWLTTVLCMLIAAALGVAAVWQSPNGFNFSPY